MAKLWRSGTIAAANMAAELGYCTPALATRIQNVIERLGLPVHLTGYDIDAVMAAMVYDKKRAGKTLRFIVPRALGDVIIIDDPGDAAVRHALHSVLIS